MIRIALLTVLGLGTSGLITGGCDKKVAEDTTVKQNPDGSKSKNSTTVTRNADGTVTKTEEHKTEPATKP